MHTNPNIILISADSLRADHLGCYGSPRPTSPHIDAMAQAGVLLDNMYCSALPTQPSHTTIFTGQQALTHGVVAHGGKARLARSNPYLSELLMAEGYTTCAVDTLFRERLWFARGYEYIIDPSLHHIFYASVTNEELNDRALRWMESAPHQPFFMFIHYWDVHYPYTPPAQYPGQFYNGGKPVDPDNHQLDEWWTHPIGAMARDTWLRTPNGVVTDPDYVTALYQGEVRYLDDGMEQLNDGLKRLGLWENTLVMLLADHGESMIEHRIFYDHYGLYDCTLRVPLVVQWPAGNLRSGLRLQPMRQLSDVAPTLLEAAGASVPIEMDGQSFLQQLTGQQEPAGQEQIVGMEATWQAKYCLRTAEHKFILSREPDLLGNPPRELYDLETDPQELHNLACEQPELAACLERQLEERVAAQLQAAGRSADPVREEGASMANIWKGHRS